jgi:hypothetical protein
MFLHSTSFNLLGNQQVNSKRFPKENGINDGFICMSFFFWKLKFNLTFTVPRLLKVKYENPGD